ncbi:CHAT domain-containing protein [Aquimarina sp. AU474]|uniref:CHAT domain-containing protein n=1 Tax=Aquimarina sp. AU474 TaxID=2108529 RepID=UPI001357A3A1|nr:CHAT domain-containing protein [Aquimarina sp. AU474]
MRKSIAFILLFLAVTFSFAQQRDVIYHNAVMAFKNYDYDEALLKFKKSSTQFFENDDIKNHLKSQLYISNIAVYMNDFSTALKTINTSIRTYTSSHMSNDSIWSELMNTKALIYRLDGNANKALQISDQILDTQLTTPSLTKYNLVKTYTIRSRILITLGNFDKAIYIIKKALDFPTGSVSSQLRAELINNLGTAYLLKDDFNKAHEYYATAYQLKLENNADFYDLAITAFNLGVVNEALREYDNALEFYKKSAEYDLKNQGERVGFIADIYMAISGIYSKKNDIEKAEEYIEKSLQKAISIFGENHLNVANVYSWYVRYLKLKNEHDKALLIDKKALDIRERSYGLYHWFPIQNLTSIAETYTVLKEYPMAQKYYEEALRRTKKMNSKFQEAECYQGMGKMFVQMGEYQKAIDFFNKSYTNFSTHFNVNHPYIIEAEVLKANAFFLNKNYEEVNAITEQYLARNNKAIYRSPTVIVKMLHLINKTAIVKYNNTQVLQPLISAYENLDMIIENIQKINKEYSSDISRVNAAQKNTKYIDKSIEICYLLYEKTQERSYLEKAFRLSEFNRNRVLVAGIRDEQFKKMTGVPDSLLIKENFLKQKLSLIKEKIYQSSDSVNTDALMSLRLDYSSQLESLLQKFRKDHAKYYQLKYDENAISVLQLQNNYLDTDTSIIEYFFGEENIFVFEINKNSVDLKKIPIAKQVNKLVKVYREQLIHQQELKKTAAQLFNILLKHVNIKNRLIIISDDVLNFLPFETLYNNDKYLIENHTVNYIGAAALLPPLGVANSRRDTKIKWIGFAPEYEENNSLASNSNEILSISRMMKGKALLGDHASVKNFVSETQNASIIHVAAHADIHQNNMMYNKLVFSKNGIKNELTASEIYTLSLSSDLVVLSACNTGYGTLRKGEGVMSMARAFQYAGARSTVMSLWKVPDKETAVIMNDFYKNLKQYKPKDLALRNAKIEYLKNTKDNLLKHPYYWAGLVVSGNTEALHSNDSYRWWIIIFVLILILISFKKLIQFFK